MVQYAVIVLGMSAGGLQQLTQLVQKLPATIPAALFVVQHLPTQWKSYLADIVSRAGDLPALHPADGQSIEPGTIYIAPPDTHMVVARQHIHLLRGPKENGFRPAIDTLFRTAAQSYGPRVIGSILTGLLDDGVAGLLAVKRYGGVAIVQDPQEAPFPDMPQSALRYVQVDYTLSIDAMARCLVRLAHQRAALDLSPPQDMSMDATDPNHAAARHMPLTPFSCPDCDGVLAEFYDGELLRFRCQVGHTFSKDSLFAHHADGVERSLWIAFTALDERIHLAQRLADDAKRLNDHAHERRFRQLVTEAQQQKERLRVLVEAHTLEHHLPPDELPLQA